LITSPRHRLFKGILVAVPSQGETYDLKLVLVFRREKLHHRRCNKLRIVPENTATPRAEDEALITSGNGNGKHPVEASLEDFLNFGKGHIAFEGLFSVRSGGSDECASLRSGIIFENIGL
jgi:hypothetical protein